MNVQTFDELSDSDDAEVRVLVRFYLGETGVSESVFCERAGVAYDKGTFNRWLNGKVGKSAQADRFRTYLAARGYYPLHATRMVGRIASRYWHTSADALCHQFLKDNEGHYIAYQMSTWFLKHVTASSLQIQPFDGDRLSRQVIERQHTGPPELRDLFRKETGIELPDQEENFAGSCMYTQGSIVFLLRSAEGFIKTVICSRFNTDGIAMSGRVMKQSRRQSAEYIHTTNLCLIRYTEPQEIIPRITTIDHVPPAVAAKLKEPISA